MGVGSSRGGGINNVNDGSRSGGNGFLYSKTTIELGGQAGQNK